LPDKVPDSKSQIFITNREYQIHINKNINAH